MGSLINLVPGPEINGLPLTWVLVIVCLIIVIIWWGFLTNDERDALTGNSSRDAMVELRCYFYVLYPFLLIFAWVGYMIYFWAWAFMGGKR